MKKPHIISTDDFEDYAPEILLVSANGNKLVMKVSFGQDMPSGRVEGSVMFLVKPKAGTCEPFASPFLDLAIAHYNELSQKSAAPPTERKEWPTPPTVSS